MALNLLDGKVTKSVTIKNCQINVLKLLPKIFFDQNISLYQMRSRVLPQSKSLPVNANYLTITITNHYTYTNRI